MFKVGDFVRPKENVDFARGQTINQKDIWKITAVREEYLDIIAVNVQRPDTIIGNIDGIPSLIGVFASRFVLYKEEIIVIFEK